MQFLSTYSVHDWYLVRLGKGLAGGGDHSASGVFIFSIVYCSFW